SIYEQGGGMVDISRAVFQDVFAGPSPLNIGFFETEKNNQEPVTKKLTYYNRSNKDITLRLHENISKRSGNVPEKMVSISEDVISIKAGQSKDVNVTVDPSLGDPGEYGGYIKAESENEEVILHTPVGFYKERNMYNLTIKGIAHNGKPAKFPSRFEVKNVENSSIYSNSFLFSSNGTGEATLQVPEGTYSVMSMIYSYEGTEEEQTELTMAGNPELEVHQDTTIILDGQKANEIKMDVGE